MKQKLFGFLLVIGILLLVINVWGLFKSMRNPEIQTEQNTSRIADVSIPYELTKEAIKRKSGESDKDFAIRINDVVSKSMSHYWKKEGWKKYNLRVPVWENYILWVESLFNKNKAYEFKNYEKNLERGVGLCSTHSIVVKGILLDNGIDAQLWDLSRHVVVRAKVADNEWYILDPDYGLYIPHDIPEIEANPELVRATYENMADLYKPDAKDPYTTDFVVEIYGLKEHRIYDYDAGYEKFSYAAIWFIPLLLILPYFIYGFQNKNNGNLK